MLILSVLMGIVGIGFLIGFHEFGHFIFCKIFHIATPTFSIGMGPTIIEKKLGETNFKLSAIPLGGYVEIAGEETQQEAKTKISPQYLFTNKPYYQKMLVIAGGIIFNVIFCYLALTFLFWKGMPQSPLVYPAFASPIIKTVESDSPAAQAGIQPGDILISLDSSSSEKLADIIEYIRSNPAKTVNVTFQTGPAIKTAAVTLATQQIQDQTFGKLGIVFEIPRFPFWQSVKHGITTTHQLAKQIASLFISPKTFRSLGGPLMVIQQTAKGAQKGFTVFLLMLAFISVNLAVLNIIPLPIMDGGQALFHTIEAIMRRPLPETIKMYIQYGSWLFVLLLVIVLSIRDVFFMIFK